MEKNNKQVLLPMIPSELLIIALRDMKKTINEGININMGSWGYNLGSKDCSVCFAGSVMLQTVKKEPKEGIFYLDPDTDINYKQYHFLNSIRKGFLKGAMQYIKERDYLSNHKKINNKYEKLRYVERIELWKTFEYEEKETFFKQIEDLITYFKSQNL